MQKKLTKQVLRHSDDKWCRLELELKLDDDGAPHALSICGSAGEIITEDEAHKRAKEYWASYFEEDEEAFGRFVVKWLDELMPYFQDPDHEDKYNAASQFVLDTDGCFHGLDVVSQEEYGVLLYGSSGQITDELEEWFPEVEPWLEWHLNDTRPDCVHQRAIGGPLNSVRGAICPVCKHRRDLSWQHHPLPKGVLEWFNNLK